jgi:hypothetical protein
MTTKVVGEEPPDSKDLKGWEQAVAARRLASYPVGAIVAAFLDLGPNMDERLRNALARPISDDIYRRLKQNVGRNHPNGGEDIIERVHGQLFEALAQPNSADAKGMRVAYVPRVMFRIKDAIAKEKRERREGEPAPKTAKRKSGKAPGKDETDEKEAVEIVSLDQHPDVVEKPATGDGEDAGRFSRAADVTLLESVEYLDQQIDVTRLLVKHVPNLRKRLAFQLFMEQVPAKTRRARVLSIADAVGVDESTVRDWIAEIQATLKTIVGEQ